MKKALVLLLLCGLVPAASAVDFGGTEIDVTADVTFMSRYIWRGYNLMGSSPVWQPSVDFDLGGGLGFEIWAAYANNAGHVNATEYNYTLYYGGSVLEGDAWKTDYTAGYRYFHYVDSPQRGGQDASGNVSPAHAQELFLELEMPQLVGGGVTPRIDTYYIWQSRSGARAGNDFGYAWFFVPGFDYNFTVPDMPELPMTFSWDITYATGYDNSQEWTHMTWGLASEMDCPMTNGKIVPQLYFQNTFDRTMNNTSRDYLYCGLSYSLNF